MLSGYWFLQTLQFKKQSSSKKPFVSVTCSEYFEQKNVAWYELPTESYFLLDLHFGGTFNWAKQQMNATLSVNNLLDEGYFNHLSLIKTIGIMEMGRNVVLQLKIPFGVKSTVKS